MGWQSKRREACARAQGWQLMSDCADDSGIKYKSDDWMKIAIIVFVCQVLELALTVSSLLMSR